MRDHYSVPIISHSIKSEVEVHYLSKWQRRLCKWFKIPAERKFLYTVIAETVQGPVRMNDGLISHNGSTWMVTNIGHGKDYLILTVQNTVPISYPGLYKEMMIAFSAYRER